MVKGYKNEDEIREAIDQLNSAYQSGNVAANQEKQTISQIKKLEASIPAAAKMKEQNPRINLLRDEKKVHIGKIAELKKVQKVINAEKKEKYEENQVHFKESEEKKKDVDEMEQQIKDQKARVDKTYLEKKELKEEFYKASLEFHIEDRETRHFEFLAKKKKEIIERKERTTQLL